MIRPVPQITGVPTYKVGKPVDELVRETGMDPQDIVKLASNENPLGMSPLARKAALNAVESAAVYPDGDAFDLKTALAKRYSLDRDCFVLGAGSNEILEFVASAYLDRGRSAVFSQYSFAVYAQVTRRVGAEGIIVPACDYGHDLDAMIAAIRPDTTVAFIANPNNPTGTYLTSRCLDRFMRFVPEHVLVVLDEAYNEYLPKTLQFDSIDWVSNYPNLIVLRTFSKAYGLAGLRVGYGCCRPEVASTINTVRPPFNVNSVAQAAAIAALQDSDFLTRTFDMNSQGLRQLYHGFEDLEITYVESYGNFVLAQFGNVTSDLHAFLQANGMIVRPMHPYELPDWLRISVGTEAQNSRLLDLLQTFYRSRAS